MSEERIRVVARVNVRPEKLDETQTAFDALVAGSRAEAGCIVYEALLNLEDPHEFTFFEEWASDQALREHFTLEHFTAVAGRAEELFEAPPDIRRYKVFR